MSATVQECQFPAKSALDSAFIDRAYYRDSYTIDLKDSKSSPETIFIAVFGHRPGWMKVAMLGRNWIAARFGLEVSSPAEVMKPILAEVHTVGGRIGGWPIYTLTELELVAGRDNKHLDFRVSVLKEENKEDGCVVISTVCAVHNTFGKLYLSLILPFHRFGVRWLITSAKVAGRL